MNNLSIANVINISVATPQVGLGAFNTANVALFTREVYASSFGILGYQIYLSATQVGIDFGTDSDTYAMAVALFAQQPNILNNGGYLVVIPFLDATQDQEVLISFPAIPATGTWEITYNSNSTTALAATATASAIQTALRLVTGLSTATVTGDYVSGFLVNSQTSGVGHPFSISANSLEDANSVAVVPVISIVVPGSTGETLDQAILRTQSLIQYFGIMSAEIPSQIVTLAAAALVQTLNKICLFPSCTAGDVAPAGLLDLLRTGGFTQSRGLFYDDDVTGALQFAAAYAGLGFSVNYSGSLTTITMNLKTLNTIQPDPGITQGLLNQALAAGADTYPSIAGVPKVICSGANGYFDDVDNLQAFVGAVLVAEFNTLAQVSTKLPQTESGMDVIKSSGRGICEQFVSNGFLAPGTWNNPTTFGNQQLLYANIQQFGYYIYTQPVSQQSAVDRAARKAPLMQIAIKYAGAIQNLDAVIYVNQ